MRKTIEQEAFAKINIFLRVTGRRDNGYHDLFSVFQEIDISDTIEVTIDDDMPFDIGLEGSVCEDKTKDLCFRAADAFYRKAGVRPQFTSIRAVKNIPSQAGLGGGSSDAACILKILQEYYGDPLDDGELLEMAASLGADVPFFLNGGTCLCEGIGDIVTPLPSCAGLPVILIKPSEGVSTGICFNKVDSEYVPYDQEGYRRQILSAFSDGKTVPLERIRKVSPIMVNDLQRPAEELVPRIGQLVSLLEDSGSVFSLMTGSGSSVFGIFDSVEKRDRAYEGLIAGGLPEDCQIFRTSMI